MQRELAQPLGDQCHHARVVRAGGDLVEQDRSIGQYEQLHAEHAPSGFARCRGLVDQPLHRGTGDGTRPFQHLAIGRRGLPGFPVVTAFLPLPDRRARDHAGRRAHRQHRQLIIQRRQRLDDHARHVALVGGAPASCASTMRRRSRPPRARPIAHARTSSSLA